MVHLARLIPALHLASHVFLNLNSSFLSIATGTKHKQTKICQRADIETNVSSQELGKPCTSVSIQRSALTGRRGPRVDHRRMDGYKLSHTELSNVYIESYMNCFLNAE